MQRPEIVRSADFASCANEAGLLLRVAQQDWRAFEQLYRIYYPRVTRFLERMMRQPHLIDEVLDDTMMVVWQKACTYNSTSRVSTWIFAIAYHKALKALERDGRYRAKEVSDEALDDCSDDELHQPNTPEANLVALQSRRTVEYMLQQLPAEQRAVIELTYYHGCSYKEIAAIVSCPVDTVKTRMFHARRKLRLLMMQIDPTGRP